MLKFLRMRYILQASYVREKGEVDALILKDEFQEGGWRELHFKQFFWSAGLLP